MVLVSRALTLYLRDRLRWRRPTAICCWASRRRSPSSTSRSSCCPFYVIAPLLYLVFHFYLLMMLLLLARTAAPFERELRATLPFEADQEHYRAQVETRSFCNC